MKEFTETQLKELIELKEKTVNSCNVCEGTGYKGSADEPCDCMIYFKYIKELVYSNIPKDYWNFTFEELLIKKTSKNMMKDYFKYIKTAKEKGLGLILTSGNRGVGKTSVMATLGKRIIQKGYEPYYVICQNIIDDTFSKEKKIIERMKNADFILIDEIDKVAKRAESTIPKILENYLRSLLPNGKCVVLAANLSDEEFEKVFEGCMSLLNRYCEFVSVEGADNADIKKVKWRDKLKGKEENLNKELLLDEAKIYIKNVL
jgi:DNA replication protein DnaC